MQTGLIRLAALGGLAFIVLSPVCAAPYTVFNWNGRTAPTQPAGPTFPPASTTTVYSGAQYYDSVLGSLQSMTVTFTVAPLIFPSASSVSGSWTVNNAGTGFTYGYQTIDEAEWRFGNATAEVQLRISMDFSHSVFNPSFMLMDIDNANSDEITNLLAVTAANAIYYPSISLVSGSVVRAQGSGATLLLDSNGGNSTDTQALGTAFAEWNASGVNHLEFTWKGKNGTSIRLSNLYAEFDPAGFTQVVPGAVAVPEPSSMALAALGFGTLALLRRRR
jgi:hypothetical protein